MKSNPLVSFIVPVFNSQKTLNKCVFSILSQTYSNIELILVDDGSTDGSADICNSFSSSDSRVKVLHINNGGAGRARNIGINYSSGKYITFVDSDDYIDSSFLSSCINYMNDCNYYISGIQTFDNDGILETYCSKIKGFFNPKDIYEFVFGKIPKILLCGPCCKLFDSYLIKQNNVLFDETMKCGEDSCFNLSYILHSKKVFIDDACYYHYYRGDKNTLYSSFNERYYFDNNKVYEKWKSVLSFFGANNESLNNLNVDQIHCLIGGINQAFIHCVSKQQKIEIIKLVSKDPLMKIKVKDRPKIKIVKFLLSHKFWRTTYFIFSLKYKK